jgi:hypothetical protein
MIAFLLSAGKAATGGGLDICMHCTLVVNVQARRLQDWHRSLIGRRPYPKIA